MMAIHPDDPPYPIFGLPRIITCEENLDRFLALVDSPANSLCLCTGSLGCAKSNDVAKMVRKYSAMGRTCPAAAASISTRSSRRWWRRASTAMSARTTAA